MTADRSIADRLSGSDIVTEARRWIGTPYVHQASCRGAGADCLGLIRGIWRELLGPEPEAVAPYTPDWAEAGGGERLLAAALRHLERVEPFAADPGDVLLFRMKEDGVAKHLGILSSGGIADGRMIHSYSGHSVCETNLGPAWARRLAGVFRYPSVETL